MSRTATARPPLEFYFGTRPTQAESRTPIGNRISDAGDERGGKRRTDAKDRIEPPTER